MDNNATRPDGQDAAQGATEANHGDAAQPNDLDDSLLDEMDGDSDLDDTKLLGENHALVSEVEATLVHIRDSLLGMSEKRGRLLRKWLERKVDLVKMETTVSAEDVPHFRRGDIAHVEFGFNVGYELGGNHFSIVLYTNGRLAVVIPMTSKKEHTRTGLRFQLDLGEFFMDGITSIAWVRQVRAVSYQRLQKVALDGRVKVRRVPRELMERIDAEVRNFTRHGDLVNSILGLVGDVVQEEVSRSVLERGRRQSTGPAKGAPLGMPKQNPQIDPPSASPQTFGPDAVDLFAEAKTNPGLPKLSDGPKPGRSVTSSSGLGLPFRRPSSTEDGPTPGSPSLEKRPEK